MDKDIAPIASAMARNSAEDDLKATRALKIAQYRKALEALSDELFLELVRIYIGVVKPPYNRVGLIERIVSFLRDSSNRACIIGLLSHSDISLICAIHYMHPSTYKALRAFFYYTKLEDNLRDALSNLEERLIVYRTIGPKGELVYNINPFLEEELSSIYSLSWLIHLPIVGGKEDSSIGEDTCLRALMILVFLSYIQNNPSSFKMDLALKKRAKEGFSSICPWYKAYSSQTMEQTMKVDILDSLSYALRSLAIFKVEGEGELSIDYEGLGQLYKQSELEILAYLAAAYGEGTSAYELRYKARAFIALIEAMGTLMYVKEDIQKILFLLGNNLDESFREEGLRHSSRFRQLLSTSSNDAVYPYASYNDIIQGALSLGFIIQAPNTAGEQALYMVHPSLYRMLGREREQSSLTIDSSLVVTITPGARLHLFIPVVRFLAPLSYSTVATFSLSKASAIRGFESGYSASMFIDTLKALSTQIVPQSIDVLVHEWYTTYESATVYKGYVLKVKGFKASLSEANPIFKEHVVARLASDIYLLDTRDDKELKEFMRGLSLGHSVKPLTVERASKSVNTSYTLYEPLYMEGVDVPSVEELADVKGTTKPMAGVWGDDSKEDFLKALLTKIEGMDCSKEAKYILIGRLQNKCILREEQLDPHSVKGDKIAANAMDLSGKLYLIHKAIKEHFKIEVHYVSSPYLHSGRYTAKKEEKTLVGTPIGIYKGERGDMVDIDSGKAYVHRIFLSQITYVRRLCVSVFT